MNIPYTMTDKGVTVFVNGKPHSFAADHPSHDAIREAILNGNSDTVVELTAVRKSVANKTLGRVVIDSNAIFVDGYEVSGRLVDRILEMVSMGAKAVDGYVRFLDNLMLNPSKRSVDELWGFVEACDLPVTPDGHLLAYKVVSNDYTDCHTGTFDNSIGAKPSMPRNQVDEDSNRTCSQGLHFCSYNYIGHFVNGSNRVMVVKVNPADVVSVPADYNNAKARCCAYEVVSELEDYQNDRITPFFTDEYEHNSNEDFDEEDFDEEDFDEEDFDEEDFDEEDFDGEPVAPVAVLNPAGMLTRDDVSNIRALLRDRPDLSMTAIGNVYCVHRETIARIRDDRTWAGVNAARRSLWPV